MPRARLTVRLNDDQRQQLKKITRAGRSSAREISLAPFWPPLSTPIRGNAYTAPRRSVVPRER